MKTILIISISSDIGNFLAKEYLKKGCKVIGTYRNKNHVDLTHFDNRENLVLFPLSIESYLQRHGLVNYLSKTETYWDTCIFLNGTTLPIGKFMDVKPNKWEKSILENAVIPCEFVQKLYKVRNSESTSNICYFSGGGVNNPFDNYSAYAISKTILHKFVELIDSEYDDLNPFILGPSYVKTKIHQETLDRKEMAGDNYQKALDFLASGAGTPLQDIFDCLEWCCAAGKEVVGGRNIAVKHDDWKNPEFKKTLLANPQWGKLRRDTIENLNPGS